MRLSLGSASLYSDLLLSQLQAGAGTVPAYGPRIFVFTSMKLLQRYQLWYVLGSDELGAVNAQCSYGS